MSHCSVLGGQLQLVFTGEDLAFQQSSSSFLCWSTLQPLCSMPWLLLCCQDGFDDCVCLKVCIFILEDLTATLLLGSFGTLHCFGNSAPKYWGAA